MVSPLNRGGQPTRRSHEVDGAALQAAAERKHRRYHEFLRPGPQRLLVLAAEVGGRLHPDCRYLVQRLVATRLPRAPAAVRSSLAAGLRRRWWSLLGIAIQRGVAATALGNDWLQPPIAQGQEPSLADLLAPAPLAAPSRLPLRG